MLNKIMFGFASVVIMVVLVILVTLGAQAGCSSSSGNGGGGGTSFTTSVPAGTRLTSLTPSQASQLCNDISAYEQTAQTALSAELCPLLAVEAAELTTLFAPQPATDASLRAACTQAYNACLSGDGGISTDGGLQIQPQPQPTPASCDPSTFSSAPPTCTATVGDLETCLNDATAASRHLASSVPSCSSLTSANLASALAALVGDGGAGLAEPVSCSKLDSTGCGSVSMMQTGALKPAAR